MVPKSCHPEGHAGNLFTVLMLEEKETTPLLQPILALLRGHSGHRQSWNYNNTRVLALSCRTARLDQVIFYNQHINYKGKYKNNWKGMKYHPKQINIMNANQQLI